MPSRRFTTSTSIRLALQCLQVSTDNPRHYNHSMEVPTCPGILKILCILLNFMRQHYEVDIHGSVIDLYRVSLIKLAFNRVYSESFQALKDLHVVGFIHRDVKPMNLSFGSTKSTCRRLYLFDFGLARQILLPIQGTSELRLREPRKKVMYAE